MVLTSGLTFKTDPYSKLIFPAWFSDDTFDINSTFETVAMLGNASPLKPIDSIVEIFLTEFNLLVACLEKAIFKSS